MKVSEIEGSYSVVNYLSSIAAFCPLAVRVIDASMMWEPTLQKDEDHRADYGNEVERQVHEVPDDGFGAEFVEGTLENLAQLLHRITARFDLAPLADHIGGIPGKQGSIECIEQCILKQPVARNNVDNCRTLVQDQQDSSEDGKRSVDEDEECQLGEVGQGEHAGNDTDGQGDIWTKADVNPILDVSR